MNIYIMTSNVKIDSHFHYTKPQFGSGFLQFMVCQATIRAQGRLKYK